MYAGVRDANDRSLDLAKLVDRFTIDQNVTVGENLSTSTNHSGEFNFGHFVLSFRVTCTENFFGSDCATFCVERDDELGHFTCDSEGNIVCREGYGNPSINCTCAVAEGCCKCYGSCSYVIKLMKSMLMCTIGI